jgi:DNA-binding transcriptional LysR family regulator
MDSLMSLRVFRTVAELKSFTAAADRLGISLPMASKHLIRLEQHLGTRLLNRTRWQVTLTETGAVYFEQIRQVLTRLDEVEATVRKMAEYGSER